MKDANEPQKDGHEAVNFGEKVLYTEAFLLVWRGLPPQKQRIVRKKVALLVANARHPSLKVHRLLRAENDVWECYLIDSWPHRLLFQYQGDTILLVQMGSHRIINRCHQGKFNAKAASA